jgi:hypothetical protein
MEIITNQSLKDSLTPLEKWKIFLRIRAIQAKDLTARIVIKTLWQNSVRPTISQSDAGFGGISGIVMDWYWYFQLGRSYLLNRCQKPRSGCSRSVANSSSGMLSGLRSLVDSTMTCSRRQTHCRQSISGYLMMRNKCSKWSGVP